MQQTPLTEHTRVKILSKERADFLDKIQHMTGREIRDKYNYSQNDIISETIEFDDGTIKMDICISMPFFDSNTPAVRAILYDENGIILCTDDDAQDIFNDWTIEFAGDDTYPAGIYTAILKASNDNSNPSKTTNCATTFGDALVALKNGKQVFRKGWNGKGMYLTLQQPDENSKMTLPYIYMRTAQGDFVPWLASQTDMLAEDWLEVKGGELTVKQLWEKYLDYLRNWANSHTDPTSSDKTPASFDDWYNKWSCGYDA